MLFRKRIPEYDDGERGEDGGMRTRPPVDWTARKRENERVRDKEPLFRLCDLYRDLIFPSSLLSRTRYAHYDRTALHCSDAIRSLKFHTTCPLSASPLTDARTPSQTQQTRRQLYAAPF